MSSGFFGALIAGFAAGLIMLGLKKILEKLPKALEGTKPMLLYPFLGIAAMGALMVFVVNPPVGAFNEWLNQVLASMGESSRVLLGAVLGGMVPPIGIALGDTVFKTGLQRVNSRQWQRISLWDFPLSQRGNPVCSFRSAAVSGCRCGRFCRGNAWNRSAEKTACSKVRKCAKKSEQKLRKVINKAQYIRTSYLSVEK